MNLREEIEDIVTGLGEGASFWCGCMEGDLAGRFETAKREATESLLRLFTEWRQKA